MSKPPPLIIEHSVRVSTLEPEKTWKLGGDTLWMCVNGQADMAIPLAAIDRLRLAFEPSRFQTNLFRCHLYNLGGKCASIQNGHFVSFGSFDDRKESYLPFVRALVSRIAAVNPACKFTTGTSRLSWWANATFLAVVFGFLLLVILLMYTVIGPLVLVKLLIIAYFTPTAFRWFSKNRPKTFSPNSIPEELLPKG